MSLVFIVGPQAVGKMTVGHELEKVTDLKLFHNHMTIELVQPYFNYGTSEGKRLVRLFREEILKAIAKSDLPGVIFTLIWEFDLQSDWDYVEEVSGWFEDNGKPVYFVELEADLDTRVERNKSEHRLLHKPTKRNIEWSESQLIESEQTVRMNSKPGEIKSENYLRINNTNLSPAEVANMIKERFTL